MNLSKAQQTTLDTIRANGGQMNLWAGQKGFNMNSASSLLRMGVLARVQPCEGCEARSNGDESSVCSEPLTNLNYFFQSCHNRVRIAGE